MAGKWLYTFEKAVDNAIYENIFLAPAVRWRLPVKWESTHKNKRDIFWNFTADEY